MPYRPMGYSASGIGGMPDKTVGWLWGFLFGALSTITLAVMLFVFD